MTRTTNARIAGFTFLFYIAVAFPSLVLFDRATGGEAMSAKLSTLALHASDVRLAAMLTLLGCFSALVLAVTLYALTREQDPDLALLALTCRVAEGVTGAVSIPSMLGLLALATATGANAPDRVAAQALVTFSLEPAPIAAAFFAVGSTLFSWLLLRGRMVPVWLAWLGVLGSAVTVVVLPLQLARILTGPITQLMWIPVAVFELVLAVWLIIKGAAMPRSRTD
ncbi:MAG TPA: DUF4386 domain-containing protein [Gemmatimonadales bacterium]|nr:DUF4386 domain-containing protein [Gemmatimonadales bacterium]